MPRDDDELSHHIRELTSAVVALGQRIRQLEEASSRRGAAAEVAKRADSLAVNVAVNVIANLIAAGLLYLLAGYFGLLKLNIGVLTLLLTPVCLISIVMAVCGVFQYRSSGGDSGKISNARNTLVYSILGVGGVCPAATLFALAGKAVRHSDRASFAVSVALAELLLVVIAISGMVAVGGRLFSRSHAIELSFGVTFGLILSGVGALTL